MIHKRYNRRKPLFWAALFLVIFLRTNTNSQSKKEIYNFDIIAKILSIQEVSGVTGQ
jgi:hypothetical protein